MKDLFEQHFSKEDDQDDENYDNEKEVRVGGQFEGISSYMSNIGKRALLNKDSEKAVFVAIEKSREKYAEATISCPLTLDNLDLILDRIRNDEVKTSFYIDGITSLDEEHESNYSEEDEENDNVDMINAQELKAKTISILETITSKKFEMLSILNHYGEDSQEYKDFCSSLASYMSDVRFTQNAIDLMNSELFSTVKK